MLQVKHGAEYRDALGDIIDAASPSPSPSSLSDRMQREKEGDRGGVESLRSLYDVPAQVQSAQDNRRFETHEDAEAYVKALGDLTPNGKTE